MTNNSDQPYRVSVVGLASAQWQAIYERAKARGRGAEVFEAGQRIIARLAVHDPLSAGEPKYNLRNAKLVVCLILDRPLAVDYGVHLESRNVFIKAFRNMIDFDA